MRRCTPCRSANPRAANDWSRRRPRRIASDNYTLDVTVPTRLHTRGDTVVSTVQVAHAIALEATLSFLGLGLPTTEPSLGLLISNGYEFLLSGKYWISVYPGIALLLTILSINLVGDLLRDVLNPRLSR